MVEFDNIKETGFLNALASTWKKSLFYPDEFFREFDIAEDNGNDLSAEHDRSSHNAVFHSYFYFIIFTYINLIFSFFWDVFFLKIGFYKNYSIFPRIPVLPADKSEIYFFVVIGIIFLLIIMGILFTIFLAIFTAVIHGFVVIMGGKRGIKNTFRIICYSSGVGVFSIFPILGFNISSAWFAGLLTMGIKETHKISFARSILSVLLPFISVSIILILFFIKILASH